MDVGKWGRTKYNKWRVLNLIRTKGPIFKAELSRMTGLSIPTIMKISGEFIDRGYVVVVGKGESSGGKPPELLEILPEACNFIGIDISGDRCSCIIMDLAGKIHFFNSQPQKWDARTPFAEIRDFIFSAIEKAMDQPDIDPESLIGIGLSIPGIIDTEQHFVKLSVNLGWEETDIVTPVYQRFGLPTFLGNSARVSVLGERWFGLGKSYDNFICVSLGRGIGSAICINGEVYDGSNGGSGELGHIIVEPNGPLCACGNRGCLETLASGAAIRKQAMLMVKRAKESTLILKIAGGDLQNITAQTAFAAAKRGDPMAVSLTEKAMRYLGIGIANSINLLDPSLVILSGSMVQDPDYPVELLKRQVKDHVLKKNCITQIMISELGERASIIGAATLPLQYFMYNGGNMEEWVCPSLKKCNFRRVIKIKEHAGEGC